MERRKIREVEDYTNAFLAMTGLILFMGFFVLWAFFGYVISLLSGLAVHILIGVLPRRD